MLKWVCTLPLLALLGGCFPFHFFSQEETEKPTFVLVDHHDEALYDRQAGLRMACGKMERVYQSLRERYGNAKALGMGAAADHVIELYANEERWVLIRYSTDGYGCVLATGFNWERLDDFQDQPQSPSL